MTRAFFILIVLFSLITLPALAQTSGRGGGGSTGGATNGIPQLNGNGTNTGLLNPTASGGNVVITNDTRALNLSNINSQITLQLLRAIQTNLVVGSGTISTVSGSRFWTNSSAVFSNENWANYIFLTNGHQYDIDEVVSSTVVRTFTVSTDTVTNVTYWRYPNLVYFYDSVPNLMGAVDGGGGHWLRSYESANTTGYKLGYGANTVELGLRTGYGPNTGPSWMLQSETTIPVFLAAKAPNNSVALFEDGYFSLEVGYSNRTGAQTPIKSPLQFATGSPGVGKVWTGTDINGSAVWSNSVASLLPAAFATSVPPIDLAATTNVDCSLGYVFFRATTNTAIAFATANEQTGVAYEIHLFNTGATATPNVTITSATKTFHVAGVTANATITYGSPVANRELVIKFTNLGGTNYMTFEDNL